ncbi:YqcI/YcgG family protein [Ureibacillus sp. BA0131]|uniref:YqcI/YcgG family protein n=1 Tax=Ureibacillus aquaedulcis TaxID=3058421 RepID=A0ABT8GU71_9BACL|nr:YqcI/YcgG family protein [Ureibacillus sp. BA0131]MDN4494968.1 YqcI/YcgG family protein [Ureibacillus sp. BA0131]
MNNVRELFTDAPSHRELLNDWEREVLERFSAKMSDKNQPFPCIPATIGFSKNQLRYGFTGDPRKTETLYELAGLLSKFTSESRNFGSYTSLIIFYHTPIDMRDTYRVEDYEQLFWKQLSGLAAIDSVEWPADMPLDPHNPMWEFCFNREKYFMYCATPAHINRQSRHFDVMMLAITPRWVLQELNKKESFARNIKARVRERLANYDAAPVHPDLNSYGAKDNFEWKQYFLRDDDTSLSKCPYHRLLKFLKQEK